MSSTTEVKPKSKFSAQFWLVIMFEFFERGSYYGMMSFISVYFTDTLNIPKESVGVIKGVIQPLLYFLPILSGAIADRFGYRKMLMIAFTIMGGGYFLTSQMTTYTTVFIALVVMGFGAGLFKPIISGSIARLTDETNSSMGFGIYYWSINLGAFLFPLILVPWLKSLDPSYVIIAAAICTSAMILPTAFFFKEPIKKDKKEEKVSFKQTMLNLIHTMANAFEIIYSPIVLIFNQMKKSGTRKAIIIVLLAAMSAYSIIAYINQPPAEESYAKFGIKRNGATLLFSVDKNMSKRVDYLLKKGEDNRYTLTIYKPVYLNQYVNGLLEELKNLEGFETLTVKNIEDYIATAEVPDRKLTLKFQKDTSISGNFEVMQNGSSNSFTVKLKNLAEYKNYKSELLTKMHEYPILAGISEKNSDSLVENLKSRSFFLLFICIVLIAGLIIVAVTKESNGNSAAGRMPVSIVTAIGFLIWVLPGLTILVKIICFVIYFSVTSLKIIDTREEKKFIDHAKFLLMIFLYSGFWVLYFQMFDSVLWYVQAYVDAATLNNAVNGFLGFLNIEAKWFFDVEHVTVINAGTIILLQLVISKIVNKFKALPTMITGIAIATAGMALLAFSTDIWIFIAGITIFSIGEMTAHPKFISYIGLIAPKENKAMYMGYIFLYGVFGSAIGGVLGAKLYVYFIDTLNQPTTLWLVFSSIGVLTIIALLLYNRFLAPKTEV